MTEKMNDNPKVLVVSNQQTTGPLWVFSLQQQKIQVVLESVPVNTLVRWEVENPDLIVLDINLPASHIIELVRNMRMETIVPILLMVASRSEEFMVDAYNAGVDECIMKPIGPSLFNAKIKVWLQRSKSVPSSTLEPIKRGKLLLIPADRRLTVGEDNPVRLTNLEFRLLFCLMSDPGHVMSIEELNERIWGYANESDSTMLKNVVYRLRRKIEADPANPQILQTNVGAGYMLVVE